MFFPALTKSADVAEIANRTALSGKALASMQSTATAIPDVDILIWWKFWGGEFEGSCRVGVTGWKLWRALPLSDDTIVVGLYDVSFSLNTQRYRQTDGQHYDANSRSHIAYIKKFVHIYWACAIEGSGSAKLWLFWNCVTNTLGTLANRPSIGLKIFLCLTLVTIISKNHTFLPFFVKLCTLVYILIMTS